jgi:hypothetical protein
MPALLALAFVTRSLAADAASNTLTTAEKADGWRLLFNGKNLDGWRNFKQPKIVSTNGWIIADGWLKKPTAAKAGDIVTVDEFTDYEFSWEWRIPPGANNGVKYFITEERANAIGHEYQMIDDATVKNKKDATASFYAVLPPRDHAPVKLAPEINQSRIIVQGRRVEHWLNGERVLEYELGSDAVLAGVATSKFKTVKGFGTKIKGRILLTDHKDEASFRNLKIRELPAK